VKACTDKMVDLRKEWIKELYANKAN